MGPRERATSTLINHLKSRLASTSSELIDPKLPLREERGIRQVHVLLMEVAPIKIAHKFRVLKNTSLSTIGSIFVVNNTLPQS